MPNYGHHHHHRSTQSISCILGARMPPGEAAGTAKSRQITNALACSQRRAFARLRSSRSASGDFRLLEDHGAPPRQSAGGGWRAAAQNGVSVVLPKRERPQLGTLAGSNLCGGLFGGRLHTPRARRSALGQLRTPRQTGKSAHAMRPTCPFTVAPGAATNLALRKAAPRSHTRGPMSSGFGAQWRRYAFTSTFRGRTAGTFGSLIASMPLRYTASAFSASTPVGSRIDRSYFP